MFVAVTDLDTRSEVQPVEAKRVIGMTEGRCVRAFNIKLPVQVAYILHWEVRNPDRARTREVLTQGAGMYVM